MMLKFKMTSLILQKKIKLLLIYLLAALLSGSSVGSSESAASTIEESKASCIDIILSRHSFDELPLLSEALPYVSVLELSTSPVDSKPSIELKIDLENGVGFADLKYDGEMFSLKAKAEVKGAVTEIGLTDEQENKAFHVIMSDNSVGEIYLTERSVLHPIAELHTQNLNFATEPLGHQTLLEGVDLKELWDLISQARKQGSQTIEPIEGITSNAADVGKYKMLMERYQGYRTSGQHGNLTERIRDTMNKNRGKTIYFSDDKGQWILVSHFELTGDQHWLDLQTGLIWGPAFPHPVTSLTAVRDIQRNQFLTHQLPTLGEFSAAYARGLQFVDLMDLRVGNLKRYGDGVVQFSHPSFVALNKDGQPRGMFKARFSGEQTRDENPSYPVRGYTRGVFRTGLRFASDGNSIEFTQASLPVRVLSSESAKSSQASVWARDLAAERALSFIGAGNGGRGVGGIANGSLMAWRQTPDGKATIFWRLKEDGSLEKVADLPVRGVYFATVKGDLLYYVINKKEHMVVSVQDMLRGIIPDRYKHYRSVMTYNLETKEILPVEVLDSGLDLDAARPMAFAADGERLAALFPTHETSLYVANFSDISQASEPHQVRTLELFKGARTEPRALTFARIQGRSLLVAAARVSAASNYAGLIVEAPGSAEKFRWMFRGRTFSSLAGFHGGRYVFAVEERSSADEQRYLVALDLLTGESHGIAMLGMGQFDLSANKNRIVVYDVLKKSFLVFKTPDVDNVEDGVLYPETPDVEKVDGFLKVFDSFSEISHLQPFQNDDGSTDFYIASYELGLRHVHKQNDGLEKQNELVGSAFYSGEHFAKFQIDTLPDGQRCGWYVRKNMLHCIHVDSKARTAFDLYPITVPEQQRYESAIVKGFSGNRSEWITLSDGDWIHTIQGLFSKWQIRSKTDPKKVFFVEPKKVAAIFETIGTNQDYAVDVRNHLAVIAGPNGIFELDLHSFQITRTILDQTQARPYLETAISVFPRRWERLELVGNYIVTLTTYGDIQLFRFTDGQLEKQLKIPHMAEPNLFRPQAVSFYFAKAEHALYVSNGFEVFKMMDLDGSDFTQLPDIAALDPSVWRNKGVGEWHAVKVETFKRPSDSAEAPQPTWRGVLGKILGLLK